MGVDFARRDFGGLDLGIHANHVGWGSIEVPPTSSFWMDQLQFVPIGIGQPNICSVSSA